MVRQSQQKQRFFSITTNRKNTHECKKAKKKKLVEIHEKQFFIKPTMASDGKKTAIDLQQSMEKVYKGTVAPGKTKNNSRRGFV